MVVVPLNKVTVWPYTCLNSSSVTTSSTDWTDLAYYIGPVFRHGVDAVCSSYKPLSFAVLPVKAYSPEASDRLPIMDSQDSMVCIFILAYGAIRTHAGRQLHDRSHCQMVRNHSCYNLTVICTFLLTSGLNYKVSGITHLLSYQLTDL